MKINMQQASSLLSLPVKTLRRWAAQGFVPVVSKSPEFLFDQGALEAWAKEKNLNMASAAPQARGERSPDKGLAQALARGGVFHGLKGETVEDVLRAAALLSPVSPDQVEGFTRKLLERERLCSTGQGKGVAVPHVRRPLEDTGAEPSVTTCFLEKPVDFHAIDSKPVFVLFLLISPSVDAHLHLLSRLAYCLRDDAFVNFLGQAPSGEMLVEEVRSRESGMPDIGY